MLLQVALVGVAGVFGSRIARSAVGREQRSESRRVAAATAGCYSPHKRKPALRRVLLFLKPIPGSTLRVAPG